MTTVGNAGWVGTDDARVGKVFDRLREQESAGIQRLIDWLKMPSVSTDPAYREDTRRAAQWTVEQLAAAGIDAELRETGTKEKPGHPIVWAEHAGSAEYTGPHVLFYGHYDVQPADPIELWESPPFEPTIKPADGPGDVPQERIVARGAVDDKGQVACFLEAVRAWKEVHGEVPVKMTILIEGEEESGSVNLERFVEAHKAQLERCDICVISDTGMLGRGKPAITTGVRGLTYTEVKLHAADQDLHSGMWGGRCPNPITELTKVLAQLWDQDRRVTIPGFYDSVVSFSDAERDAMNAVAPGYEQGIKKIGMDPKVADVGEKGFTNLEREWIRPTAEINGIFGGYMGEGAKTVIPAWAGAKVSFRLVADQDPRTITELFFGWLKDRTPAGCRWELHDHGGGHPGNVASDSPFVEAASRALEVAGGVEPAQIKTGGSIPVVGLLKGSLGIDTLLVGFGLDDDRVHSPNEKFELDCYRLGARTHAAMLAQWLDFGG